MKFIHKHHISLFLASIIYAASLFALPPAINVSVDGKYETTFAKSETVKVSGFTKNEINTTNYIQTGDVKSNGFTQNLFTTYRIETTNIVIKLTAREITLFNSGLSQLSKKILIFPFHTFW